jgi:hypothetical protein
MNARAVLGRWIGVPLLAALLALLGTLGAQAQDPALAEPGSFLIRPGVAALDVYCGVDFTNEDPYMWVDATDAPCPDLAIAEVRDIQITGNVAWATVVVGDETELHVYLNKDGAWERFPYVSAPDAGTLYMLEQENAFVQQQNPGATAASPSAPADPRSSRYTVNAEADFLNMLETESAYEERFNPGATASIASPNASADLGSSRYTVNAEADFLNMLETENAYEALHNATVTATPASPSASADLGSSRYTVNADADFLNLLETENAYEERFNPGASPSIASPSVSVDPRGENYWNEWLAGQEGSAALTPPSITVSPDSGALSAGALEPEIHVLNGSKAKTLADLLAEIFGSAWPGQLSAGEDLTRELE